MDGTRKVVTVRVAISAQRWLAWMAYRRGGRRRLESIQPYKGPHGAVPPLLSMLREFDDCDKHRLLNVVLANVSEEGFHGIGSTVPNPTLGFGWSPGRIEYVKRGFIAH
jgi:hypothetical protein